MCTNFCNKSYFAQLPPSRTVHAVSNVEVVSAERSDEATVRCGMKVTALRRRKDGLAIEIKKLVLISRDLPIENLSFLL